MHGVTALWLLAFPLLVVLIFLAGSNVNAQTGAPGTVQGTVPAFPGSEKCTTSQPCRNITGEVVKIEESYWVAQPNGVQSHIRVVPGTKIESRVKVGDSVAAQVTSNGVAEAILKMDEPVKREELQVPSSSLKEIR
jgi:exosome complex RNA-binding protein Csl4